MTGMLIQLAAAWLGSLGFALIFNVRGRKLFSASIGGLFAWGVYLAVFAATANEYAGCLAASFLMTAYAELMARKEKCPVTLFLVTAAIPLIPGGALYRTMDALMGKNWEFFVAQGSYTLLFAGSIAVGIMVGTIVFYNLKKLLKPN